MYKISLIDMPFASAKLPSIALTQLKSVLETELGERVTVDICYINHDFVRYLGSFYGQIVDSLDHLHTGLGDWLFRPCAFPGIANNADDYFRRCYPRRTAEVQQLKEKALDVQEGLDDFLSIMIDKYQLAQANLVGLTSMFIQNMASFAMARKIKALAPEIVTVMGGANCEYPMGGVIIKHVPYLDFAFSGPGLKSFTRFVTYLLDGVPEKCHDINGVISRSNLERFERQNNANIVLAEDLVTSGAIFPSNVVHLVASASQPVLVGGAAAAVAEAGPHGHEHTNGHDHANGHGAEYANGATQHRAPLQLVGEELDINYPLNLDYDSYLDSFGQNVTDEGMKPALAFETSRGCWWGERSHCTFCGLNDLTLGYRFMKPERAIAQFEQLFTYADRVSHLEGLDVIVPRSYMKDVLPHLATPSTMTIFYEAKSSISEEDIKTLAKARVKIIQPGVESLATSTLKLMRKGSTAFQNITLLKNCALYDVYPTWNMLVGFPGELEEVYQKYMVDLPLLVHLPPPSGVHQVRFDRFSPYFNDPKSYGLELVPMDHYSLIYPFPQAEIENLAYFFKDKNYDAEYFTHLVRWISKVRQLVDAWRDRWPFSNPAARAQLYSKQQDGGLFIHDTRSGSLVEYAIQPVTWRILQEFEKPTTADRVAAHLSKEFPDLNMAQEMALIKAKGLVFEEENKYINLVMPAKVPLTQESEIRQHRPWWIKN